MKTTRDWILIGATGCALVGTFHAEYTLGVATGGGTWVALTVPGALDLYVIRALQVRRDVFVAVMVMVAANVASRLVHAGIVPVDWRLYSAVGALAPLLLWRIHALFRQAQDVPVTDTPPATDTVSVSELDTDQPREGWWEDSSVSVTDTRNWDEAWEREWKSMTDTPAADPVSATQSDQDTGVSVTDTVPAEGDCDCFDGGYFTEHARDCVSAMDTVSASVAVLPLPPGFKPDTASTPPDTVEDRDVPAWGTLCAYLDTCKDASDTPTLRGLMDFGHMGQPKARRLLVAAGVVSE